MKKTIILLAFSFALNANASDLIFKKNLIKDGLTEKPSKKIACEEEFEWQVGLATDMLAYCLENPPSGANSFYYNTVWANYNTAISNASKNKKICNSL